MKIYLAGPMAGMPEHNFPAFNAKAKELRSLGHEVYNPAEIEPDEYAKIASEEKKAEFHNGGYRNCLSKELVWICNSAEGMYLLKGWEHSKGANSEFTTGKAVGVQFFYEAAL
jgi:Domain of unknown function (DUF4406)